MYNRIRVYPYKIGSQGASVLCESLRNKGMRTLKVYGDRRYNPRRGDFLVNWGSSTAPIWGSRGTPILNHWDNVRNASNKLWAFEILKRNGVSIPEFTTDIGEANDWRENGKIILARSILGGHSGNGITIISGSTELIQVPLYVKYIKKEKEYRVHVFNGQVIDIQQKKVSRGAENVNYQVRSHNNGWVYTRQVVAISNMVRNEALAAISALGLSFGAVDIIYNRHYNRAYVLEVNTAPGLEGSTIDLYTNRIEELFNNG